MESNSTFSSDMTVILYFCAAGKLNLVSLLPLLYNKWQACVNIPMYPLNKFEQIDGLINYFIPTNALHCISVFCPYKCFGTSCDIIRGHNTHAPSNTPKPLTHNHNITRQYTTHHRTVNNTAKGMLNYGSAYLCYRSVR
jgi:hypothetical protein